MKQLIDLACQHVESPLFGPGPFFAADFKLPAPLVDVLRVANGFVLKAGLFRLLGASPADPAADLTEWNKSQWIREYGELADRTLFFAEDIFGDQYGFRYQNPVDDHPLLVKFWCEGGQVEPIRAESLTTWLLTAVLNDRPSAWDAELAGVAIQHGLEPRKTEHLAFCLPLILGGEYSMKNLEVLDRTAHLCLLGQISRRNSRLQEGSMITHFRDES